MQWRDIDVIATTILHLNAATISTNTNGQLNLKAASIIYTVFELLWNERCTETTQLSAANWKCSEQFRCQAIEVDINR